MPAKKTKRQLADEAYFRTLQVELEQDIAISSQEALSDTKPMTEGGITHSLFSSLPESCPGCGATSCNGWPIWNTLLPHVSTRAGFEGKIQCGQCSMILTCTREVYAEAKRLRQEKHQQNVKETRPKRERFDERGNKL